MVFLNFLRGKYETKGGRATRRRQVCGNVFPEAVLHPIAYTLSKAYRHARALLNRLFTTRTSGLVSSLPTAVDPNQRT